MFRKRGNLWFFLMSSCYISSTIWQLLRFSTDDTSSTTYEVHRVLQTSVAQNELNPSNVVEDEQQHHTPLIFGLVMQQFAKRILSRHITSSHIVVVAPDAISAVREAEFRVKDINNTETIKRTRQSYSVGGKLIFEAVREGHCTHAISSNIPAQQTTLDDWWNSFENEGIPTDETENSWLGYPRSNGGEKPSWILLAVFDLPPWTEDTMWKNSHQFLKEATATYIVIGMHSMKQSNDIYQYGGLEAARLLLQRRYKLQTLSVSHYHAEIDDDEQVFDDYGPNALLQSIEKITEFLKWGADAARRYSRLDTGNTDEVFSSYIFATQGLDLAIPSPQVYLAEGRHAINPWEKIGIDAALFMKGCPRTHRGDSIDLQLDENLLHVKQVHNGTTAERWSFRTATDRHTVEEIMVWMDAESVDKSEAACVKNRVTGTSKCITRILGGIKKPSRQSGNLTDNERPNILLVLLDPISRSHFKRVMPQTMDALQQLDFFSFSKYTAVGPNSGPNQAALYSGVPLEKRDGIGRDLHGEQWLWDRLRSSGYVTLKGEDGCSENSNMIQSLSPNTTHGAALQGLFCFDSFVRPNCMGPDRASTLLLTYGHQFISTYENRRKIEDPSLRWASFLHFTDSHEDTMMLAATVDHNLSKFLNGMEKLGNFEHSVVILCSDHGLHYGPNFPTKQGRIEATEPILYVRIPEFLREKLDLKVLQRNAGLYTTPFDVHETLLELTQTSSKRTSRRGMSLTKNLPQTRLHCRSTSDLIPVKYCDLRNALGETSSEEMMERMPKLDSFFWDIPLSRRPLLNLDPDCQKTGSDKSEISLCARDPIASGDVT